MKCDTTAERRLGLTSEATIMAAQMGEKVIGHRVTASQVVPQLLMSTSNRCAYSSFPYPFN
jgi:hypothetical protein